MAFGKVKAKFCNFVCLPDGVSKRSVNKPVFTHMTSWIAIFLFETSEMSLLEAFSPSFAARAECEVILLMGIRTDTFSLFAKLYHPYLGFVMVVIIADGVVVDDVVVDGVVVDGVVDGVVVVDGVALRLLVLVLLAWCEEN
jgi:hypothetical protein